MFIIDALVLQYIHSWRALLLDSMVFPSASIATAEAPPAKAGPWLELRLVLGVAMAGELQPESEVEDTTDDRRLAPFVMVVVGSGRGMARGAGAWP